MRAKNDVLKDTKNKIVAAMGHLVAAATVLVDLRKEQSTYAISDAINAQLDSLQQLVDFIDHTVTKESKEQKRRQKDVHKDEDED